MKVLYLSSEVAPYSKTGGLADVAGALPAALAARGHEVVVVTPLYGSVRAPGLTALGLSLELTFPFGTVRGTLHEVRRGAGHRVLFVEQPDFFAREGLYVGRDGAEHGDNHRRFAFFSMAALSAAQAIGFHPDLVQASDWQTGLAMAAIARGYQGTPLARARTVFTIHNLAYQGCFPKQVMEELGIPWELFTPEGLEFYDLVSFLKAGLAFADALTTVSPTYSREIQTPEGGQGLDGLLRRRALDLHGILNGVDDVEWDPSRDPLLPATYSAENLAPKALSKAKAFERFGLARERLEHPLFAMVTRLAEQKGIDLVLQAMDALMGRPLSLAVVGSGEPRYQRALEEAAGRYPGQLGLRLGFDSTLAHLAEAGADFFLMPSHFEPCGLNQMYSLRYGTVPIVRATGGLEDTVVDLSQPGATGVKFQAFSSEALVEGVDRALALYRERDQLVAVQRRGMACDFSWDGAAARYESLFRSLCAGRPGARAARGAA